MLKSLTIRLVCHCLVWSLNTVTLDIEVDILTTILMVYLFIDIPFHIGTLIAC